jgi:hypothetical protein
LIEEFQIPRARFGMISSTIHRSTAQAVDNLPEAPAPVEKSGGTHGRSVKPSLAIRPFSGARTPFIDE